MTVPSFGLRHAPEAGEGRTEGGVPTLRSNHLTSYATSLSSQAAHHGAVCRPPAQVPRREYLSQHRRQPALVSVRQRCLFEIQTEMPGSRRGRTESQKNVEYMNIITGGTAKSRNRAELRACAKSSVRQGRAEVCEKAVELVGKVALYSRQIRRTSLTDDTDHRIVQRRHHLRPPAPPQLARVLV